MAESGQDAAMTFWDHLEELRGTIIRSVLAVCLVSILGFIFKTALFKVIFGPANPDFVIYRWLHWTFDLQLINVEVSAQFFVHLKAACGAGFVLAFPYIIWELWRFIAPALYEREKKAVRTAFIMSTGLFYLGVAVGYFLVFPACVQFFMNYSVSPDVSNTITLSSYMSMFSGTVLMIGVAFEFPTVILALSRLGVLSREDLRKGRRYAIVAVLIIAAIVTPADPLSMFVVAIPLYLLYEASILVCHSKPADSE